MYRRVFENSDIDIVGVVFSHRAQKKKIDKVKHNLKKVRKIGFLGALNGIRIRSWFLDNGSSNLFELCQQSGLPYCEVPSINSDETKSLFKKLDADLGMSLGNGYIGEALFSIPKYGMLNIHMECLPEYQGAQSVIWPIYNKEVSTGFTIHQIDRGIDTGDIFYRKELPILFNRSLRDTVKETLSSIWKEIPCAFSDICSNYSEYQSKSIKQGGGGRYTTPSFSQFLKMLKNNKKFMIKNELFLIVPF